ncbi:cytochrome P450 [Saccharothrix luteola]|uniref:cytochrome P450 n=1 Tax=Saccharothrix luteola TaxID=2893018 RepID=UPI001E6426FF|nr:cytochrome P450 [Saccharothrix luteola]MCC8251492.1 cytochrome P450 [Saccharothrix luteola]
MTTAEQGAVTAAAHLMSYPAPRTCPFEPPPEYARLRAQEPVSRVRLTDGSIAWLVTRHRDARFVLSDPRFAANRHPAVPLRASGGAAGARPPVAVDGDLHAKARGSVGGEFTAERAGLLRPRVQELVDRRVDAMLAGGNPADLVGALALPVPSLVIGEQLGVPHEEQDLFQELTARLVRAGADEEEREAATAALRSYLADLVARKERVPGEDLLSRQVLARRERHGEVDRDALVDLARLLVVAGHEPTAGMISLGALALMRDPDQVAGLLAHPERVPGAVEELLRYFTVVEQFTARVAVADVEVSGVPVRRGEAVIVSAAAADRDEAAFADPDRLDLGRDARHHLAFGFGPHQCVGQHVARVQVQVALETLFRRVPGVRLAVAFEDLEFKHETHSRGLHELLVTW